MNIIDLIGKCARVPSWSTHEDRLIRVIESAAAIKKASLTMIPDNNIIIRVPGMPNIHPVALTAHLDKINHFGDWEGEGLPFMRKWKRIKGQLDDAAGVGICLYLIKRSASRRYPPLLFLFSEMEERGGYEKEAGSELFNGIGSCRISQFLMDKKITPQLFITIDTSPQFKGEHGVALYSRFWEKCGLMPEARLVKETEAIEKHLKRRFPFLCLTNGSNDYINYGMLFNMNHENPVPSIAIEPAIYPSHKPGECVYVSDIKRTFRVVEHILLACGQGLLLKSSKS